MLEDCHNDMEKAASCQQKSIDRMKKQLKQKELEVDELKHGVARFDALQKIQSRQIDSIAAQATQAYLFAKKVANALGIPDTEASAISSAAPLVGTGSVQLNRSDGPARPPGPPPDPRDCPSEFGKWWSQERDWGLHAGWIVTVDGADRCRCCVRGGKSLWCTDSHMSCKKHLDSVEYYLGKGVFPALAL